MRRKLSTREKVMIGVLAVAAVVAYRAMIGEGIGFGGGGDDEAEEARQFGDAPVVRMDLLARQSEAFDPAGRNLFDYYVPPPPPRKAPPPRTLPKPPPRQATRAEPPPPPPPQQPKAPLPTFSYLGYLGPKEARIAVFDAGEGVRLARVGDVVEKDYRLLEFKHDGVTLGYTDEKWSGRTADLQMAGVQ